MKLWRQKDKPMSIVTTFHLLSSVGLDSILMRRLKESLSEIIKNCLAAMVSSRLLTIMSYMLRSLL